MKLIKFSGKTGLLFLLLLMCLFSTKTYAQYDVYQSAYFDGTTSYAALWNPQNNTQRVITFEVWVKQYSFSTSIQTILNANSGGIDIVDIHIQGAGLSANYGDTAVTCVFPTDTNWHHVAFICDTVGVKDNLSLYVDGTLSANLITTHLSRSTLTSPRIGSVNVSGVISNYFKGHMARYVVSDTVLYTTSFTPDCVFDTTNITPATYNVIAFNNAGLFLPNDYTYPSTGVIQFTSYDTTYRTSPCAPVYTFSADTSALDSVTNKATNHNYSYMKGAHGSTHYNGWDTSLHTTNVYCPNIIYGYFVDSITVYSDTVINYYSEYFKNTSNHHDTVTTSPTLVNAINQTDINVYPSPASGYINIICQSFISAEIVDLTGIVYLKSTEKKLSVKNLPAGNYVLRVMSLNGCVVKKILVIH